MDPELLRAFRNSRPQNAARRDWYSIRNALGGEAEVFIYDFIGWDPFFGGVSAQDFVRDLRGITASRIHLRINSPGGDIAEAVTIRNALREHPAAIWTHIDGLAASSASWVGLDAEKVIMSPHAMMMIHEPWMIMAGDAADFRKGAEVLNKFGAEIAEMLAEKAGGSVDSWRERMRAETWYSDQEAVDAGLADEIGGTAAVQNRYDPAILKLFRNVPEHLLRNTEDRRREEQQPDDAVLRAALDFHREQSRRLGVMVGG